MENEVKLTTIQEFFDTIKLVHEFFKGDWEKTNLWFYTDNPLLGNIPPAFYFSIGRSAKLLKFVQTSIEENTRAKDGKE